MIKEILEKAGKKVGLVGTIDWGDGTTDTFDEAVNNPSHEYFNDGAEYIITAKGTIAWLDADDIFKQCLKEIIHIGDCGITSMGGAFYECYGLTEIPSGIFDKCTEETAFYRAFYKCINLKSIPEGMFDKCTKVKDFANTFNGCTSLTSIPEGLFDHCTEVTNFEGTFVGCSSLTEIPEGLFDNNTKVTNFTSTFAHCYNLQAIPQGLFDNCPEVTTFGSGARVVSSGYGQSYVGCFGECTNLQVIPTGLFDNNTKVTSFRGVFAYTSVTAIPVGLFDNCPEVTTFEDAFFSTNIVAIPAGLFDYNRKVTGWHEVFKGCTNLTGESPYTIINIDGVDTKVHLYERRNYPVIFSSKGTLNFYCFKDCTGLTDYNNIPSGWK